jgi:hypothetical protein
MRAPVIFFIAFLNLYNTEIRAQEFKIPAPSTSQVIEQDFGLGKIVISYARPNTKGRKIFGETEPYGIVWRTGANSATKIKLTDSLRIEGHMVAPGEYALFTIPGANEWTIILNKTATQWGAYSYDSAQDLLRFKVKASMPDKKVETFTIQFVNMFTEHCELQLLWENTLINIHIETDVDNKVMENIRQAMNSSAKKPYYQAAIYYYNHDKDIKQALSWMNEVEKVQPKAYNVKYWKARILLKAGDKSAAIASANEGLKLATDYPNVEYIRLNKEVLAEAKN